jgi:hypothetical protein
LRKLRFKAPMLERLASEAKGMTMSEETLGIADIPEILRLLPHCCPFLFDRPRFILQPRKCFCSLTIAGR